MEKLSKLKYGWICIPTTWLDATQRNPTWCYATQWDITSHYGNWKKTKVCLNAKICDEIPHSTARCYTTRRGETQRDATQRDEKTSRRHVTQNAKRPHAMWREETPSETAWQGETRRNAERRCATQGNRNTRYSKTQQNVGWRDAKGLLLTRSVAPWRKGAQRTSVHSTSPTKTTVH